MKNEKQKIIVEKEIAFTKLSDASKAYGLVVAIHEGKAKLLNIAQWGKTLNVKLEKYEGIEED